MAEAYRGGGSGVYYPDESIRFYLPYASSITITVSYPNKALPYATPCPSSNSSGKRRASDAREESGHVREDKDGPPARRLRSAK